MNEALASSNPPHKPPLRSAHRSWRHRIVVWAVVLLLFAGLFLLVSRQRSPLATAQTTGRRAGMTGVTISVIPATARQGEIGVYQEAIGTVTPFYTGFITSQVTGLVTAVHYHEGQLVRQGDALIDIDARALEAQLAQAEGTLEKDRQILAQAKMDLERYRSAWAKNGIAKQTMDDQEKLVAQQEGLVRADEGVVQYDKVQVSYCHITAPFNGRVGLRFVDPGNVVQANGASPLVVVAQQQPITVVFTAPEDALGSIQAQLRQHHDLKVYAFDRAAEKQIATGKLAALDNQIDTTTGTVKLRALFENRDGALFPNQFVNTRLLVQTLKDKTLIPTSAIQHNGPTAFVYLIQNGTVQMRTIQPGTSDGGMTAVDGIQPGDIVANSSFEKLQPNLKVNLAPAPAQPRGSSLP